MRYVLLDRITELRPPELAAGVKCVSLSDDVFVDHFPGHPLMPGALILEALAATGQLGAAAALVQAIALTEILRRRQLPPIAGLQRAGTAPLRPLVAAEPTAARAALGISTGAPGLIGIVRVERPSPT